MYIPNSNLMANQAEAVEFMKRYSFATIVTAKDNVPSATHLPFAIDVKDDKIVLSSHFAKANPQWQGVADCPILVMFNEPHAYISPDNYDKEQNVPTWNYVAVHCYGTAKLVTAHDDVLQLLEKVINTYEPKYQQQWQGLPEKYKIGMMNGIVAFEVEVTDVQGKKKISQGSNLNEQRKIVETLSKSSDTNERTIADYMQQRLDSLDK